MTSEGEATLNDPNMATLLSIVQQLQSQLNRQEQLIQRLSEKDTPNGDRSPDPEVPPQETYTTFPQRPTTPGDGPPAAPIRRKPLPVGDRYDGNTQSFQAWRKTMEYKLIHDKAFIGGTQAQFMYLWGNLTPSAQSKVTAYFENGGIDGAYDPAAFLGYMETVFADPHRQEIATTQLEQLRQGTRESFASFYVRFEQKLALAGGLAWADEVKLMKLRRALSPDMRSLMVGKEVSRSNFADAIARLRAIAVDLESFRIEENAYEKQRRRYAPRRDHDGDTPMTGINRFGAPPTGQTPTQAASGGRPAPGTGRRATWADRNSVM